QPVADVDHAGVLAGALDDAWPLGGQAPEVHAARFVRAVLAPHDAEDTELGVRGHPPERALARRVLVFRELVLARQLRGNGGVGGEARGLHWGARRRELALLGYKAH